MPGKVFFYEDECGTKRDVEYLEEFHSEEGELFVMLQVILDFVERGHSLDEGVELFGTEELRQYHAEDRLTKADLEIALAELNAAAGVD